MYRYNGSSRLLRTRRLMSYQEYLAGMSDELGGELAASESEYKGAGRSIIIGVATGALIFVVNRWLERLLR